MPRLGTEEEGRTPKVGGRYPGGRNRPTRRSALLLLRAGLVAGCARRLENAHPGPGVPGGKPLAGWELASPLPAPGSANRVDLGSASDLPRLASMRPGTHYVVTGTIDLGGGTCTVGGG